MNDDLISRQDAKVAMRKLKKWYVVCEEHTKKNIGLRYDDVMFTLDKLPSAQPTQNNTSNALKSLDCIDRQEAIDVLNKLADIKYTHMPYYGYYLGALHDAADNIKALPSVDADRMHSQRLEKGT